MKQLLYRLKIAFKILFNPKLRWIFIPVPEKEFEALLGEERANITMQYHRMQEYNLWCTIKNISACKDDVDMILDKAIFTAQAEEYIKSKTK